METQPQPPQQSQYQKPANRSPPGQQMMKMTIQPSQLSDNDRSSSELRALDCNLTSLCDHIQIEGFNSGAFSDVVVLAMGSTYHLHRLILSRSPYFRNMLHGPWKEATAPTVNLHIDDNNVNGEAITMALAYLYGHHPKLNDNNAFRVLAAASFLDLQDLCAICTDFIISELWTINFLAYQVFAESQDYGIHGERVRNACWGYLCQSGSMELKEVLPKLSSQTLHALLTSDELWVPSEEKRYELALYSFLAKCAHCKQESSEHGSDSETGIDTHSDSSLSKGKNIVDSYDDKRLESELGSVATKGGVEGPNRDIFADLGGVTIIQAGASSYRKQAHQISNPPSKLENGFPSSTGGSSLSNSFSNTTTIQTSRSYSEIPVGLGASGLGPGVALEGPSDDGSCFHLNDNDWLARDDYSRNCSSMNSSSNELIASDWGRCGVPSLLWGGRTVGKRQLKGHAKTNSAVHGEEYNGFVNIFEGGSVLYCNMSFEALLTVRKQLEELGFPCKAVNDGLWLQMLLSQRVQEIGADTCKNCCFVSVSCVCRQPFGLSHGVSASGYYLQEHDLNNAPNNMGNVYIAESAPSEGNGPFRPARLHVRVPVEGLAGIGRGNNFVPATAWPPTRFVFSRVPFGMGNRNCQQSPANDDPETRIDHNGDISGDGLTALVGLSQGGSNSANINGEPSERGYEMDLQNRMSGTSISAGPSSSAVSVPVTQSTQHAIGVDWESTNSSSISLDMSTPLSHFPPFRFGVQFEDVHRLSDGQVKHSPEVFYAGSFWKVSIQAFNDEDPQGRRTLGLFLHRRKAEIADALRKVHLYVDSREKVTARYQLICPSKREVMVFGSFKQAGTLLPKAPKGWGWRTALLFDELPDLLQNRALRVAAVIQLV